MGGHDVIVLGASAGGVTALRSILSGLPGNMDAAIFIAQHTSPDGPGLLPVILSRAGDLPAVHPKDRESIKKGQVYVAPPDHHLLIDPGYVRVLRGPKENHHRPSIDVLFRSAARAYGPRVIGVVLTGNLNDGTVGLQAIKRRGGLAIVQDPDEAQYRSMPDSALRYVQIDYRLPLAEIPAQLKKLVSEPAPREDAYPVPLDVDVEARIAEQQMSSAELMESIEKIGVKTNLVCPECRGTLWQVGAEDPVRFRCHVGHALTMDVFMAEQTDNLEQALWSAVRVMEEKVSLARLMKDRMAARGVTTVANRYERYAAQIEEEAATVRRLILHGLGMRSLSTVNHGDDSEEA